MAELPKIISVDDHIVEPADVWTSRMPAKFKDAAPHIVRKDMPDVTFVGGKLTVNEGGGRCARPTGGSTRSCSGRCCGSTRPSACPVTRSP